MCFSSNWIFILSSTHCLHGCFVHVVGTIVSDGDIQCFKLLAHLSHFLLLFVPHHVLQFLLPNGIFAGLRKIEFDGNGYVYLLFVLCLRTLLFEAHLLFELDIKEGQLILMNVLIEHSIEAEEDEYLVQINVLGSLLLQSLQSLRDCLYA